MKRFICLLLVVAQLLGLSYFPTPAGGVPSAFAEDAAQASLEEMAVSYALLQGLTLSLLASSESISDPFEKEVLKSYGEWFHKRAQKLEAVIAPHLKIGFEAFQRFLALDFILETVNFQVKKDPSQVDILKEVFSKSIGLDFKEIENEHRHLFSIFKDFPIYQEWKERVQKLLEVGTLAEQGDRVSVEKMLAETEDFEFKKQLQSVWAKIEEEKAKRDELEKISGKRDIDFDKYAQELRRKEFNLPTPYFDAVNRLFPDTKRILSLALFKAIQNNNLKEADRLKPLLKKEQIEDSDVRTILERYLSVEEKLDWTYRERAKNSEIKYGFKKQDPWTTMTGAPATTFPYLSRGMMGILVEASIVSAITSASVYFLGPKGLLVVGVVAGLFTTAQYGDEYLKTGHLPSSNFLKDWSFNALILLPVAAGFKILAAISPFLALGVGTPLMVYNSYAHYQESEYLQMGLSALLAVLGVFQGIRLVGHRNGQGKWRIVPKPEKDPKVIRLDDFIEPRSNEWMVYTRQDVDPIPSNKIVRFNPLDSRFRGNDILRGNGNYGSRGGVSGRIVDEGGPARRVVIIPDSEEMPTFRLVESQNSAGEVTGIEIDPKSVHVSDKQIGMILPFFVGSIRHSPSGYRHSEREATSGVARGIPINVPNKKGVIIIRRNAEREIIAIFIKFVGENISLESLKVSPFDEIYLLGSGDSSRNGAQNDGPQASQGNSSSSSPSPVGGNGENGDEEPYDPKTYQRGQPIEVIRDGKLTSKFRTFAEYTAKRTYNQFSRSEKPSFSVEDLLSDFYRNLAKLIDHDFGQDFGRQRESINQHPPLYFIETMRNAGIGLIRKEIRDHRHQRQLEEHVAAESRRQSRVASSSLDEVIANELSERVNKAMELLEREEDRKILNLAMQGLSYQEMATSLGISSSRVAYRLYWAKKRLKAILEEKGLIGEVCGAASDKVWIKILLTGRDDEWPKIIPAMMAPGCGADEGTIKKLEDIDSIDTLNRQNFEVLKLNWDDPDLIPLRDLKITDDLKKRIAEVLKSLVRENGDEDKPYDPKTYQHGQPIEVIRDWKKRKLTDGFVAFAKETARAVYHQMSRSEKLSFSVEELLSEFDLKLARLIHEQRESINLHPPLYFIQIMRNLYRDLIREEKKDRRQRHQLEEYAMRDERERRQQSDHPSALNEMVSQESVRALDQIMNNAWESLSPDEQQVLKLAIARPEASYEEIARELRISKGAVRGKLHRARKKLREVLESSRGAISDVRGAAEDKTWIKILLLGNDEEWPKIIPAIKALADETTRNNIAYLVLIDVLDQENFEVLGFKWDDSDLAPLQNLVITEDRRIRIAEVIQSLARSYLADIFGDEAEGENPKATEPEIILEDEWEPIGKQMSPPELQLFGGLMGESENSLSLPDQHEGPTDVPTFRLSPSSIVDVDLYPSNRFEAALWLYGTRGISVNADDEDKALEKALVKIIVGKRSSRHDRSIALDYYLWIFGTFHWDQRVNDYLADQANDETLRGIVPILYSSKAVVIPREVIERLKLIAKDLIEQGYLQPLFYIYVVLARHGVRTFSIGHHDNISHDIFKGSLNYLSQRSLRDLNLRLILVEAIFEFHDSDAEIALRGVARNDDSPTIRKCAENFADKIWSLHEEWFLKEKLAKMSFQLGISGFCDAELFFRAKLIDEDPQVVEKAKGALRRIGRPAVPFLTFLLDDPDVANAKKSEIGNLIDEILRVSGDDPSRSDADGAASDKVWIKILLTSKDHEWPKIWPTLEKAMMAPGCGADEKTKMKLLYLVMINVLNEKGFKVLEFNWDNPDLEHFQNLKIDKNLKERIKAVYNAVYGNFFGGLSKGSPSKMAEGISPQSPQKDSPPFSITPPDLELPLTPRTLPPFQGGSGDGRLAEEKFLRGMYKIEKEILAKRWLSEMGYRVDTYEELMKALVEVVLKSDEKQQDKNLAIYYYILICKTFPEAVWDKRLKKQVAQADDQLLIDILPALYDSGTIGLFHFNDEAILNRLKRFGEKLFDEGDRMNLFYLYAVLARNGVGELFPGHDILMEAMNHLFRRGDVSDIEQRFVLLEAVRTFRDSKAEMVLRNVFQNGIEHPAVRERAKIFLDEIWDLHEEMASRVLPEELALALQKKFTPEECIITRFFKERLKHKDPHVRKRAEEVLKRVATKETVPGMPSPREAILVLLQSLMDDASAERRGEIRNLIDEIPRPAGSE